MSGQRQFAIALSFDGAHRDYIRQIAEALAGTVGRERLLFDEYIEHLTARPEGDLYLASRYRGQAELVVVFLCSRYAANPWAREEWRHIRRLITDGQPWRIMFVELEPPGDLSALGILPGDFAMGVRGRSAKEVAEKILDRLASPAHVRPVASATAVRRGPVDPRAPGGWSQLLAAHGCPISDQDPTWAVTLTKALLRVAVADEKQTRADHRGRRFTKNLDRLRRAVSKELTLSTRDRSEYELFAPDMIIRIVMALDECCGGSDIGGGAPAFVVAQEIDRAVGYTFIDSFRGERELADGDPLPLVPPLLEHFPAERDDDGTDRDSIDGRYDRVAHLRLAPPEVEGLRVRLLWKDLDPLDRKRPLAAIVTNRHIDAEFVWREYVKDDAGWFYGLAARDVERQRARIVRGLDQAREVGAAIVVLPELALTPALRDSVAAEGAFARIPLAVVGSAHDDAADEAAGRNVAHVYARGERIHEHSKVVAARYTRDSGTYHEHLQSNAATDGFDVLLGPGITAVVLICEDVEDQRLMELLQAMAPTLVLLPAMSDRPDQLARLRSVVERLARDYKSFSMVACIGSADAAMLGVPGRREPAVHVTEIPSVAVFTPAGACTSLLIDDT